MVLSGETATLLAKLANAETQREMAIMVPISLLTQKLQVGSYFIPEFDIRLLFASDCITAIVIASLFLIGCFDHR